jgi:beta-glucuronidase
MLRPQDTATRERKPLPGLWRFRLDGAGEGRAAEWFKRPLADAREMAVPASFNDVVADAAVREYFGDIWYQTTVRVPRGWDGQRIVLHFESATHRATVWVNDAEVVSHEGGYTPFEAEVTEHVQAGEEARVTAVVNNTLSFQTIPPGVIEDTPHGRRQRYFHDFFNYAGIHRPVWLYATAHAHLTDITVVTPTTPRSGSSFATPTASRWRAAPAPAAPSRWRTSTGGPRATATCTTSRPSWSARAARSWTATTRAWACVPWPWTAPGS